MSKPWLSQYSSFVPTELPLPQASMIDIFEQTVAANPQSAAIHYFDRTISFGELNERADQFAALLASWDIGHGDRVAISAQNDPEFLVTQYGAWKRGAIVVPLSPMFKKKEIGYQLADCGAKVYVAEDSILQKEANSVLAETPVQHVIPLSEFAASLDAFVPSPKNRVAVSPDDMAYLVYTSGTTGPPKGSISLHRHIAYNANTFRTWFDIGPGDVILGIAPLFHITGIVAQIALSALSGVPLILYHRFDAWETFRLIEKWKATMAVAAITAYIALLRDPHSNDLSSFTKCCTGGAPVAPAIVEEFQNRFGVRIHNTYGLTEVNSPSHLTPLGVQGRVDSNSGALAIGLPIPGCEARIVDLKDAGKVLPPDEVGEIALKGPFLFSGYWNKPEATAKAFHDNWFLTGDVAKMDEDGWFYIVDRKKDMIVASGYKVWPRDVEDVLYQHPGVREAAVIGVPDPYRGETVKAVIALRPEFAGKVSESDIIEFTKQRMASYKYPRIVEFVLEIPKTASGKFLRRELRGSST